MKRATQKSHNIASNNFSLKCTRCSYEWEYRGAKKPGQGYRVYASCPRCLKLVEILNEIS